MKTNKNIIYLELKDTEDWGVIEELIGDEGIKFMENITTSSIYHSLLYIYKNWFYTEDIKKLEEEVVKVYNKQFLQKIKNILNEEEIKDLEEEIGEELTIDTLEDNISYVDYYMSYEDIRILFESTNLNPIKIGNIVSISGTVGYSPWSYYIATSYDTQVDYRRSWIRDLWDGYNFYDIIAYNENGEYFDSLGCNYITNEDDLMEVIDMMVGDNDYRIIKNNEYLIEKYIPTEKLVDRVVHTTYSFVGVE